MHSSFGKCPCFLPFRGRSNITINGNIIGGPNNGLFSIAPCKVITLNLICFFSLSIVIAFPNIAKVNSDKVFFTFFYCLLKREKATTIAITIVGRAITVQRAILKRSHGSMYKSNTKKGAKGY